MTHINWQKLEPKTPTLFQFHRREQEEQAVEFQDYPSFHKKPFLASSDLMWKVGQLSFLYPRWSWPTLIYGIATGPKIAKILLFLCVLHTDFNVGKVMCFCIFILTRSFVFPFYRAGCLPADCTVDLNNFCSKLLSQHLHGLDIYLYQIIIYPIWPKCWHCHKRKGDQNCAILSFSFHIVNFERRDSSGKCFQSDFHGNFWMNSFLMQRHYKIVCFFLLKKEDTCED